MDLKQARSISIVLVLNFLWGNLAYGSALSCLQRQLRSLLPQGQRTESSLGVTGARQSQSHADFFSQMRSMDEGWDRTSRIEDYLRSNPSLDPNWVIRLAGLVQSGAPRNIFIRRFFDAYPEALAPNQLSDLAKVIPRSNERDSLIKAYLNMNPSLEPSWTIKLAESMSTDTSRNILLRGYFDTFPHPRCLRVNLGMSLKR